MDSAQGTVVASVPASKIDPRKLGHVVGPAVLVGLAYYVGCLAGFALRFPLSGISFFWPPTAVLAASLMLARPPIWPALLIGAFAAHGVAHASDGVPVGAWLIQFGGNGIQAVLAAMWASRWSRIDRLFPDVRSTLTFIAAACVAAPAIASLIPAAVYVQLGWAPNFWDAWLARALTNAVASMTLIPALFAAGRFLLSADRQVPARSMEFALLTLGIGGVHLVTAFIAPDGVLGLSVALFAPLPFLLWAVVRCGSPGLSFALLWTTLLTVVTAASGYGPFVVPPSADTVLGVHVFLGASTVLMLLIGGLMNEQQAEHARLLEAGDQNNASMARLREAQQRYELATAAGGVGVWDWNMRTGDFQIEGDLKRVLGYANGEIRDHLVDWMRLVDPLDRPALLAHLDAFTSGAVGSFNMEFRLVHRDGSRRWIASKGAVTERIDDARTHAVGTYADVTDRKASERALREATDALARTWRISAMTELSASLAHELNQPLTAIVTNATACISWIESGTSTAELKAPLTDVVLDARRASHIVERTRELFVNRPSEYRPLDINDVVRDILEIAQPRLRELHIALDLRLDAGLPPVIADAVQIRQVILNLVINAADAMRDAPDHRLLSIRSRRSRNVVAVNVRDTGRGFSQETRRQLFEPFYTTKAGGLGMGLAISRSIMRSHTGSIHALRNVGDGATFRVKLPAAESPIATALPGSTRRVLLVDDHVGVRTSLARLLRPLGHEVAEATTGAEALAVARSFKPEYAIVDISLNDMSGIDLARGLREIDSSLRLFALTAYRDDSVRESCLAAGFDGYLVKPEDIGRIQELLG